MVNKNNDEIEVLDSRYATTRRVSKKTPIINLNPKDEIQTQLFLPANTSRKAEGGLRSQGYFKVSSEDKPLITVITVVFNGEKYLEETILSVIRQTYDNVEYIIIDGGSTDRTIDVIKKYQDKIDYWVSEKDEGIYDAMNKGVYLVNKESYLYFLNSGDIFYNNNILFQLSGILNKQSLVLGKIQYDTNEIVVSKVSINTYLHNTIHHQAVIYPSNLIKKIGFDFSYQILADYKLNLILLLCYKIKIIQKDIIMALCDSHGISRTNLTWVKNENAKIKYELFNKILAPILILLFNIKLFLWKIIKL